MGSSDFLPEAAIDDDSEKCYLPSHSHDPTGMFDSLSHLGFSTGFYAMICTKLTMNIYITFS